MPDDDAYQANFKKNSAYIKPGKQNYNTSLSDKQEIAFRQWVADHKVPFDSNAKVSDYDMRGFYKALMSGDKKAQTAVNQNDNQIHYPDYWKTPYHQTFSAESQWADPKKAPTWNDKDQLVGKDGKVLYDEKGINAPSNPPAGSGERGWYEKQNLLNSLGPGTSEQPRDVERNVNKVQPSIDAAEGAAWRQNRDTNEDTPQGPPPGKTTGI